MRIKVDWLNLFAGAWNSLVVGLNWGVALRGFETGSKVAPFNTLVGSAALLLAIYHWWEAFELKREPPRWYAVDEPSPLAESAPVDLELFRRLRSGPVPDGFADGVNTKLRKATRLNMRTLEETDVTSLYFPKPDTEKTEAEIEADNNLFIESMKRKA